MTIYELERNKNKLTKQQYKTLKGQLKSGDKEAMLKGLNKIIRRG